MSSENGERRADLNDIQNGDVFGLVILLGACMRRHHNVFGLQQSPHHIQDCTQQQEALSKACCFVLLLRSLSSKLTSLVGLEEIKMGIATHQRHWRSIFSC